MDPLCTGSFLQDAARHCKRLLAIGNALRIRIEPLIKGEFGSPGQLAERAPQCIVRPTQDDGLVGGIKGLIRAQRFVTGARFLRLYPALPESLKEIPHEADCRVEQRSINRHSLACSVPLTKSGKNGD